MTKKYVVKSCPICSTVFILLWLCVSSKSDSHFLGIHVYCDGQRNSSVFAAGNTGVRLTPETDPAPDNEHTRLSLTLDEFYKP